MRAHKLAVCTNGVLIPHKARRVLYLVPSIKRLTCLMLRHPQQFSPVTPSINLPDTLNVLSRRHRCTFQTPSIVSRHYSDTTQYLPEPNWSNRSDLGPPHTFQTRFRNLLNTFQTPFRQPLSLSVSVSQSQSISLSLSSYPERPLAKSLLFDDSYHF